MVFFLFACNKENVDQEDTSSQQLVEATEDISLCIDLYIDIFDQANEALIRKLQDSIKTYDSLYLTSGAFLSMYTSSANPFPATIIIDYKGGKTDADGIVRKGKLTVNTTGFFNQTDAVITIESKDYYVSNYEVKGKLLITNKGMGSAGFHQFNFEVDSAIVINFKTNEYMSFSAAVTSEWTSGDTSFMPDQLDDSYAFSGTFSGITRKDLAFTAVTNSPIIHKVTCKSVNAGSAIINLPKRDPYSINYGNGECDEKGFVIYKGVEYPFRLLY